MEQHRFNQAETLLRDALSLDSANAALLLDLASALEGRLSGRNDDDPVTLSSTERDSIASEALQLLHRAQETAPSNPVVYLKMGSLYFAKGMREDALAAFEQAVRFAPDDPSIRFATGDAYLQARQFEHAREHLERCVELAPDHLAARIALGNTLVSLGSLDEAAHQLELIDQTGLEATPIRDLQARLTRARKSR